MFDLIVQLRIARYEKCDEKIEEKWYQLSTNDAKPTNATG